MEDDKIAFIFDTNFIVQHTNLDEVLKKLNEIYVPYVTQVSIEERKSQQCNTKKKAYETIREAKMQIKSLVELKCQEELDEELEKFRKQIQKAYEKHFEGTIINYDSSSNMFGIILRRAFDKIPPFNDNDRASDKGFKDTLMWLSIIEFFKNNGENKVIFLTDDSGFINKADVLTKEFEEKTGKKIEIKQNSIFGKLIVSKKDKETSLEKEIPNIESIREQLREILDGICWITEYNYFGDEQCYKSFLTSCLFDEAYIKSVMDNLDTIIQEHFFSDTIQISVFLDRDNRIYNDLKIDIRLIERLNRLYKDTLKNYPNHITAFINTISEKLNENYEELNLFDDSDLPF